MVELPKKIEPLECLQGSEEISFAPLEEEEDMQKEDPGIDPNDQAYLEDILRSDNFQDTSANSQSDNEDFTIVTNSSQIP